VAGERGPGGSHHPVVAAALQLGSHSAGHAALASK
jgi:hypothetical protein